MYPWGTNRQARVRKEIKWWPDLVHIRLSVWPGPEKPLFLAKWERCNTKGKRPGPPSMRSQMPSPCRRSWIGMWGRGYPQPPKLASHRWRKTRKWVALYCSAGWNKSPFWSHSSLWHSWHTVFANATFNCLFSCLGLFLNLQAAECKCNSLGCSHTRVTHVELYTILPNEPSNSSNPTYVVAILILLRYLGQTSTLSRWI